MYFGLGMRQDLAGALKWAKASAAQGVEPAKKLQGIIEEKMREPALTPALERGGNPLSELPKSASMERLDAVMDNVRMRRDAGKKYGLPWESDQTVVLDAVRQLVKRGENAKANGLIAMSRQIMANAAGEQETIYGKFGRELARLEASASKSGTGRSTRAR